MPKREIENQIRDRVDSFVAEISELIRDSAFQVVEQALGGPERAPASRGRGGPIRRKKKAGRRGRRSAADLEQQIESILAHIQGNPGQRLEEISAEFSAGSGELRPAIQKLLWAGRIRTEGRARGTRYFAGGSRKRAGGRKKAGRRRKKGARRRARKSSSSAAEQAA